MKELLFLTIGLVVGTMYGITMMCFFQINSLNRKK